MTAHAVDPDQLKRAASRARFHYAATRGTPAEAQAQHRAGLWTTTAELAQLSTRGDRAAGELLDAKLAELEALGELRVLAEF